MEDTLAASCPFSLVTFQVTLPWPQSTWPSRGQRPRSNYVLIRGSCDAPARAIYKGSVAQKEMEKIREDTRTL